MTIAILFTFAGAGCAGDVAGTDDLGQAESAIRHGTIATESIWRRTVHLPDSGLSRTGTLISPTHVLTRATEPARSGPFSEFYFGYPEVGDRVRFYTSGPTADQSAANTRTVTQVLLRPGVNQPNHDVIDTNGDYADLAILVLSSPAPAGTVTATMAWGYPSGGDDLGKKVGAGSHDGSDNSIGLLRTKDDWTYSGDDVNGAFLTEDRHTDYGDDGGPFLYQDRVLGVMSDRVFEWEEREKYTSLPTHLSWVLSAIGYAWGPTVVSNRRLHGLRLQIVGTGSHRICQYACERSAYCAGYNFQTFYGTAMPYCKHLAIIDSVTTTYGVYSSQR